MPGIAVCCAVAVLAACAVRPAAPMEVRDARLLMGTQVTVIAVGGAEKLRPAIDDAFASMQALSEEMNHYDPASRVSAINRAAGIAPVAISPALMTVLAQARALSVRTEGAFDVTIGALSGWRFDPTAPRMPSADELRTGLAKVGYRDLVLDTARGTAFLRHSGMRIDLGGIAKLYIVERGLRMLRARGVARAMIDAGGDIAVFGGTSTRPWRVGIRDPRAQGLAGVVELRAGFVVSSGDYERFFIKDGRRYHHILDPRTGFPTAGLQQVTLVGATAAMVNGLSAAAMVLGPDAARALIEATPGVQGLLVAPGLRWTSPGFPFAP